MIYNFSLDNDRIRKKKQFLLHLLRNTRCWYKYFLCSWGEIKIIEYYTNSKTVRIERMNLFASFFLPCVNRPYIIPWKISMRAPCYEKVTLAQFRIGMMQLLREKIYSRQKWRSIRVLLRSIIYNNCSDSTLNDLPFKFITQGGFFSCLYLWR